VFKLTEEERLVVTRTVVAQAKGRVPVVINTGGDSDIQAVAYSLAAQEAGADALMCRPPVTMPADNDGMRRYFKAISDAVAIPVFMQDTSAPSIPASLAVTISKESPHCNYIKVESLPTTTKVAQAVEQAGDALTVFGGAGGNYFVEEMRRGSVGTMPSCSQTDDFVKVWDLFQAGDVQGAYDVFYRRILPVNRLQQGGWGSFYYVNKEILRRRGAMATNFMREPSATVDAWTLRELDEVYEQLYG
jgi:4-hydroxy-tetrahydrodipicolinate synthase